MVLIDTNVLLDVLEDDSKWAAWTQDQLDAAAATDSLAINPIIYSELSMAFARIEELDAVIKESSLNIETIPQEALFLAGKVFLTYRKSKGTKHHVLPDFFIGATPQSCNGQSSPETSAATARVFQQSSS